MTRNIFPRLIRLLFLILLLAGQAQAGTSDLDEATDTCAVVKATPAQETVAVTPQGLLVLTRVPVADSIASNDRITLEHDSESREVFASEGRAVQRVTYTDLDGDGVGELLIQMDLGGSGGFREFELLCLQDGGYPPVWQSVWLETGFPAGEASVHDGGNGRRQIHIVYTDTEADPPCKATAIFEYREGTLQLRPK